MQTMSIHTLLLAVLLILASPIWAADTQTELHFQRCQIEKNALIVDAQCAVLTRPENPSAPQGKTIELFVAKFPARNPDPAADALTVIQGGPGMSSIDLYLSMQGVFKGINAQRDVIVVDQRGTGRSNMLTCPQDEETAYLDFDATLARKLAIECLEQLDADSRFYTTSVAVADLEAVRLAAGYSQLSIYGVSYGTRVAQHYLRQYPDATRAVILDGVADVGLNLAGSEIARRSQQAFDRMASRCTKDQFCARQFGDLNIKFDALIDQLSVAPVEVSLAHPLSGVTVNESFTKQHLLGLIRLMPYSTESLSLMPLLISQAHAGNFTAMAAQALLMETQFTDDYAYAMNNAIVCTEDAPFLTELDKLGDKDTYFGTSVSEAMQAVCAVWPQGVIDTNFRKPFTSQVPALLLSGENDPITPPENAERALKMFENGLHLDVPDHGHGVIGRGCLPKLVETFIKQANVIELQTDCIERERAQPFFISPAGPKP